MRPIKAIRKYCLWCSNHMIQEISLCPNKSCSLWVYRFGKKKSEYEYKLTSCKAIKKRCKDCMPHKNVINCKFNDCELYPFRLGKNPNRKGLGGHENIALIAKKHRLKGRFSNEN